MIARPAGENTVERARWGVADELRRHAVDCAALDARLLVGHATGLDHAGLIAEAGRMLTPAEAGAVRSLAARRLSGEPVARILGQKEFWGLPLKLNSETLVPRPESETVVEAALAAVRAAGDLSAPLQIADLGTGAGGLLLALLKEMPAACGIGTDISVAALACARDNAAALGLAARAWFVACSYGTALSGPINLIVSNPPYVPRGDISTLAPEVRVFDPLRALDGGPDGLDGMRAVAHDARRLLAPKGIIIAEVGHAQSDAAMAIFTAAGLVPAALAHDLSGVPRVVVAQAAAL